MELPINLKDLDTIVNALALGGDTRLYFLLKNFKDDVKVEEQKQTMNESRVKIYSESDDYKCKHGECDI
jgi:hypothetical protein